MTPSNPMVGVTDLGDGLTPVDIWQGLHANARAWADVPYGASRAQDRLLIDGTDLSVLKALADYPADRWLALCEATGMTVYGAIGLSWCAGTDLDQVWQGWEESGFVLKPLPEFERPARLINPDLLPQSNSLTMLASAGANQALPVCAMIAALSDTLNFDMPASKLQGATGMMAAFLKSRMLQNSKRATEDDALISIWSKKVSGTEYDVWAEMKSP